MTWLTWAGLSALATYWPGSSFHSTTSIFSPLSSLTMFWMRTPRTPTHEPTGSMPSCRADDGDLGAEAGLAGDGLDLDGAREDLRHLLLEQAAQHQPMRTRDDDLRPARRVADLGHVHAQALALVVALGRHLLGARHDGLGAIDLDDDRARLDALDDAVDDLALALGELVEDEPALGVAQLLHDHLLGGLRGDAAELGRRHVLVDLVAGLGVGEQRLAFWAFEGARLLEDDQVGIVLDVVVDVFDDGQPVVDVRIARFRCRSQR